MKTFDDVSLLDIMPAPLVKDENTNAAALAIDPQLQAISQKVDRPALYADLDGLVGRQLDHLAMQWDITVWSDSWTDAAKISVLKAAIENLRKKGTKSAIWGALESVEAGARIVEWFEEAPQGTPHTFKVFIDQDDLGGAVEQERLRELHSLIDDAKPARSQYELKVQQPIRAEFNLQGVVRPAIAARISSESIYVESGEAVLGVGAWARGFSSRQIAARGV